VYICNFLHSLFVIPKDAKDAKIGQHLPMGKVYICNFLHSLFVIPKDAKMATST